MMFSPGKPDWTRERSRWPHSDASRFIRAGGLEWHVQVAGEGPDLLMAHGTGAAGMSWRDLFGPLSRRFRVIVPDLPGHGFTQTPPVGGLSLPGMSRLLGELLGALGASPALAVGHSAGAAILCRMALDGRIAPGAVVAFNGAFLPFKGMAGQVFPPLARLLVLNPIAPRFFALGAVTDPASIERLILGTGSRLDPAGLALYRRLIRAPGHVAAALRMMASWDLAPLVADLPRLGPPLTLAVGTADRAVDPAEAREIAARVPGARVVALPGLGHLAHEEDPARALALIAEAAAGTTRPQGGGGPDAREDADTNEKARQ
ncbi:alpha/beta fold hydrolase [Limibaculum sp. FT325]|uniref:alpha/beta fold hydrolase BchO n=1 Tax=Thermohalobaculum sediminis TaxID=2939436 RepID=UPI0020C0FF7D|nr:alpha/beta fold hydrolase BchO [Limibaculum sediminis]MCL5775738.1 alpha/beta fold hydrolase [Limibaculum sediminis]